MSDTWQLRCDSPTTNGGLIQYAVEWQVNDVAIASEVFTYNETEVEMVVSYLTPDMLEMANITYIKQVSNFLQTESDERMPLFTYRPVSLSRNDTNIYLMQISKNKSSMHGKS